MRKKLRKTLVRFFAMSNFALIYGKQINGSLRVASINSLIGMLGILIGVYGSSNKNAFLTGVGLSACVPIAFFYFFTKYYFKKYPVQWSELDTIQKFSYGEDKEKSLTSSQQQEWKAIQTLLTDMKAAKENLNVFPTIAPAICAVLTIALPLVYLLYVK